jgi:hypothetical protein
MRRFALPFGFALSLIATSAIAQDCDGFTDVQASSPFCPDVTRIALKAALAELHRGRETVAAK